MDGFRCAGASHSAAVTLFAMKRPASFSLRERSSVMKRTASASASSRDVSQLSPGSDESEQLMAAIKDLRRLADQFMAAIKDLGRLPRSRKKPVGGQIAKINLEQRLARARKNKQLSVEQEAELERIAGFGSEQVPRTLPRSTLDRPQSDPRSTPDGDAMHHYAL